MNSRQKLYNALTQLKINVGTEDEFNTAMDDSTRRERLYSALNTLNIDVGPVDEFHAKMTDVESQPAGGQPEQVGEQPEQSGGLWSKVTTPLIDLPKKLGLVNPMEVTDEELAKAATSMTHVLGAPPSDDSPFSVPAGYDQSAINIKPDEVSNTFRALYGASYALAEDIGNQATPLGVATLGAFSALGYGAKKGIAGLRIVKGVMELGFALLAGKHIPEQWSALKDVYDKAKEDSSYVPELGRAITSFVLTGSVAGIATIGGTRNVTGGIRQIKIKRLLAEEAAAAAEAERIGAAVKTGKRVEPAEASGIEESEIEAFNKAVDDIDASTPDAAEIRRRAEENIRARTRTEEPAPVSEPAPVPEPEAATQPIEATQKPITEPVVAKTKDAPKPTEIKPNIAPDIPVQTKKVSEPSPEASLVKKESGVATRKVDFYDSKTYDDNVARMDKMYEDYVESGKMTADEFDNLPEVKRLVDMNNDMLNVKHDAVRSDLLNIIRNIIGGDRRTPDIILDWVYHMRKEGEVRGSMFVTSAKEMLHPDRRGDLIAKIEGELTAKFLRDNNFDEGVFGPNSGMTKAGQNKVLKRLHKEAVAIEKNIREYFVKDNDSPVNPRDTRSYKPSNAPESTKSKTVSSKPKSTLPRRVSAATKKVVQPILDTLEDFIGVKGKNKSDIELYDFKKMQDMIVKRYGGESTVPYELEPDVQLRPGDTEKIAAALNFVNRFFPEALPAGRKIKFGVKDLVDTSDRMAPGNRGTYDIQTGEVRTSAKLDVERMVYNIIHESTHYSRLYGSGKTGIKPNEARVEEAFAYAAADKASQALSKFYRSGNGLPIYEYDLNLARQAYYDVLSDPELGADYVRSIQKQTDYELIDSITRGADSPGRALEIAEVYRRNLLKRAAGEELLDMYGKDTGTPDALPESYTPVSESVPTKTESMPEQSTPKQSSSRGTEPDVYATFEKEMTDIQVKARENPALSGRTEIPFRVGVKDAGSRENLLNKLHKIKSSLESEIEKPSRKPIDMSKEEWIDYNKQAKEVISGIIDRVEKLPEPTLVPVKEFDSVATAGYNGRRVKVGDTISTRPGVFGIAIKYTVTGIARLGNFVKQNAGFYSETELAIFKRLLEIIPPEQAEIIFSGNRLHAGFFDDGLKRPVVYGGERDFSATCRVVLHEVIHQATQAGIDRGMKKGASSAVSAFYNELRRIKSLVEQAHGKSGAKYKPYGFTNEHEFVAEAFSNREFQDLLRATRVPKSNVSIWTKFLESIQNFLGIKGNDYTNALDAVFQSTENYWSQIESGKLRFGQRQRPGGKFLESRLSGEKPKRNPNVSRVSDKELRRRIEETKSPHKDFYREELRIREEMAAERARIAGEQIRAKNDLYEQYESLIDQMEPDYDNPTGGAIFDNTHDMIFDAKSGKIKKVRVKPTRTSIAKKELLYRNIREKVKLYTDTRIVVDKSGKKIDMEKVEFNRLLKRITGGMANRLSDADLDLMLDRVRYAPKKGITKGELELLLRDGVMPVPAFEGTISKFDVLSQFKKAIGAQPKNLIRKMGDVGNIALDRVELKKQYEDAIAESWLLTADDFLKKQFGNNTEALKQFISAIEYADTNGHWPTRRDGTLVPGLDIYREFKRLTYDKAIELSARVGIMVKDPVTGKSVPIQEAAKEFYWTHKFDYATVKKLHGTRDALFNQIKSDTGYTDTEVNRIIDSMYDNMKGGFKEGNIEYKRTANIPGWLGDPRSKNFSMDTVLEGLKLYFRGVSQRVTDLYFLEGRAPDKFVLNDYLNKIGEEGLRTFARSVFDEMRGITRNDGLPTGRRIFNAIRSFQVIRKLGLGAIQNSMQSLLGTLPLNARTGYTRALKEFTQVSYSVLRDMKTKDSNMLMAEIGDAMDAIVNIGHQTMPAKSAHLYLTFNLMSGTEKFNRLVAVRMGRKYVRHVLNALHGSPSEPEWFIKQVQDPLNRAQLIKELKMMGITQKTIDTGVLQPRQPFGRYALMEDVVAGKRFSTETQFGTRPLDLPLWANSPMGRVLIQFQNFNMGQAAMVHNHILKPFIRNPSMMNAKPLLAFLVGAEVTGFVNYHARRFIYSKILGIDLPKKEENTGMKALEYALSVSNLAVTYSMFNDMQYGRLPGAGPTIQDAQDVVNAFKQQRVPYEMVTPVPFDKLVRNQNKNKGRNRSRTR